MQYNAKQITANLIAEHGVRGALETVKEEIADAHARRDFYRLSFLRETKRTLQEILDPSGVQEEPSP